MSQTTKKMSLIVLLAANDHLRTKLCVESLERMNIEYEMLGLDSEWKGFLQSKIVAMHNRLLRMHDARPVCIADAYDSLFLKSVPKPRNEVVVSSEKGGMIQSPIANYKTYWRRESYEGAYFNAGFVYGRASSVRAMLRWCKQAAEDLRYDPSPDRPSKRVLYNITSSLKVVGGSSTWVNATEADLSRARALKSPHGFDQILISSYADAFPHRVYLDASDEYSSVVSGSTLNTSAPVVHVPFIGTGNRMALYKSIAKSNGT